MGNFVQIIRVHVYNKLKLNSSFFKFVLKLLCIFDECIVCLRIAFFSYFGLTIWWACLETRLIRSLLINKVDTKLSPTIVELIIETTRIQTRRRRLGSRLIWRQYKDEIDIEDEVKVKDRIEVGEDESKDVDREGRIRGLDRGQGEDKDSAMSREMKSTKTKTRTRMITRMRTRA